MRAENNHIMADRFRSFLPVVVDVETGGFNAKTDALLEIAAIPIEMDESGYVHIGKLIAFHVEPFKGANIEPSAIEFIGIDPSHPLRIATPEEEAIDKIFRSVRKSVKNQECSKAILVGHNASFDLNFVMAAAARCNIKRNPFHPFSCFDTATLSGLVYGQTVLAKACEASGVSFDKTEAHSAKYDTTKTAELFCNIVNRWKDLGGWL